MQSHLLELLKARMQGLDLLLEVEHALDAGEVQPQLGGHLLDAPQPLHVLLRVEARALRRALGLDQAARLVYAQRLRMHLRELCGDRDHEHAAVGRDLYARDALIAVHLHTGPITTRHGLPPWTGAPARTAAPAHRRS